jgi:hypothetical protein
MRIQQTPERISTKLLQTEDYHQQTRISEATGMGVRYHLKSKDIDLLSWSDGVMACRDAGVMLDAGVMACRGVRVMGCWGRVFFFVNGL